VSGLNIFTLITPDLFRLSPEDNAVRSSQLHSIDIHINRPTELECRAADVFICMTAVRPEYPELNGMKNYN